MRHAGFLLTLLLLVTLAALPAGAALLDAEFNKNGEIFVLVGRSQAGYPPAGIYKTCEYKSDDTGKRDAIVAGPTDLARTYISKGGGAVDYYGIAVNKDRRCYTFSEEVATAWTAAPPTFKTRVKVVNNAGSRSGWYAGGCGGNSTDYLAGGCGAAHTPMGHQTGGVVYWRAFGGKPAISFTMLGTGTFGLTATFNATGEEIVGAIGGKSATFPCSLFYPGDGTGSWKAASGPKWSGEPWPTPVPGTATTRTVAGVARQISTTGEYMMPVGMWYHNADKLAHTYYPRAGILYMNLVAKKDHDLKQHQWVPTGPGTPWSSGIAVPDYTHSKSQNAVFQLFETKFHVYVATPCGDGCMSEFDKKVYAAGDSHISITITPFGRSYGLQVVNDQNVKMISVKQADPVYNAAGNITDADPNVFEFTSDNWDQEVLGTKGGNTKRTLQKRLKIINTGSSLSYTNWNDAKSVATSYKFKSVEASFGDKEEFVYLSDREQFCVSDNWFGTGGTVFYGTPANAKEMYITTQTRKEVDTGTPETITKHFKITSNVQDIAADGYGNFFFLCTTDLNEIVKMMNDNINDFNKIKTLLTAKDAAGFAIAENYKDPGGFAPKGPDMLREITFDVVVYKTIYKIGGGLIGEKAKTNKADAVNIGNPFSAAPPEVVGRIPIGKMSVSRSAIQNGAAISWFNPELVILSGSDLSKWPAEIASINIAAPPEEQGVNYYIDLAGPTGGPLAGSSLPTGADAGLIRAQRSSDTIFEGDTHTWGMENPPAFNAITELNETVGTYDKNANGIIGGVRNNVIRNSFVFHWKVYRLYDIKKLALPWPIVPGETEAAQKAGGEYQETLLDESWYMFKNEAGKQPVGDYERLKEKQPNKNLYFTKPGFKQVDKPYEYARSFKESGIYKVVLEVIFDYYEYSAISFGENRGALNGFTYKRSSQDLSQPGFFSSTDFHPVFNHTIDTRFVTVLSREALADGKYIKNVTVGLLEGGSVKREGQADEIDRSRERASVTTPKYEATVAGRRTPLTDAEVDAQRMKGKDIVGDFAIKFVSALPDRGEAAGNPDRELAEKFGGIGVWDYDPDENPGHAEAAMTDTFSTPGNSRHPPNWDPDSRTPSDEKVILKKVEASGKPYASDRQMYVRRNYGMHGRGTLVRALSQAKLDEMQKGMAPTDPFFEKIIAVPNTPWNAGNGKDHPIRQIDWSHVKYQWYISYKVGGKVVIEEPPTYRGDVAELLRFLGGGDGNRAFISRLGSKSWPATGAGNLKDLFTVTDDNGTKYDIDSANMPAFHVRIPMLERIGPNNFKPIRWETPIAPEKYQIGLKVSAPTLVWKNVEESFKMDPTDPAGAKNLKDRIVHYDLFPGGAKDDEAFAGPTTRTMAEKWLNEGVKPVGLDFAQMFVVDREPPRFSHLSTDVKQFCFKDASTGDKYTRQEMKFAIVDNNPNCDIAKRDSPASADEGMGMLFPLNDGSPQALKSGPSGGSTHETVPYVFGSGAMTIRDEGDCFAHAVDGSKEMWGAPYGAAIFELPVAPGGGAITEEALTTASPTSAPFMPPDYDGNLFYSIQYKIAPSVVAALKIPADVASLTVPTEYRPSLYFEVTDNDPPQVMIDVLTSFTEIDKFGVALTDLPNMYDFATKSFSLNTYRSSMNGNNPASWPAAVVDKLADGFMRWGPSTLKVLAENENSGTLFGGVNPTGTVEAAMIRSLTPFKVYIPEKSRAVFAVKAVDNVQRDGEYRLKLKIDEGFSVQVDNASTAELTEAMKRFREDLQYADDVADPFTYNLLGLFRTPMGADEPDSVLKIRVSDGRGNEQQIDLPVRIVNTFFKQEKLDMENRRLD